MHADRPGDRPRILYWYRTAPGIVLGRAPLDEDAIRTIEDHHPDIEFDWPAILAMSEMMTHEEEAPPARPQGPRKEKKPRRDRDRDRAPREDRTESASPRFEDTGNIEHEAEPSTSGTARTSGTSGTSGTLGTFGTFGTFGTSGTQPVEPLEPLESDPKNRLVEELAGREIGARLRARHAEIVTRIESLDVDGGEKDALFKRAEAIDPELWMTPESVLEGVRNADALFEKLRAELSRLAGE